MNKTMLTPLTEYAGFWRRFGAGLLDALLIGQVLILLLYLCNPDPFILAKNLEGSAEIVFLWHLVGFEDVLPALIILFCWLRYKATPGKMLMDCEIVDAQTGERIGFGQAVIRYFGYIVSFAAFGLGFFWIAWDKRKQGWHDKMANTVVVLHDEAITPLHQLEQECH